MHQGQVPRLQSWIDSLLRYFIVCMQMTDVAVNVLDTLVGLETSVKLASFEAVRFILPAGSLFWILAWNKDFPAKNGAKFPRYFGPAESEQPLSLRLRSHERQS